MNTNLKMVFINRISRIIIRINKMINLMDIWQIKQIKIEWKIISFLKILNMI
jgi:hypothetical protein